jgi:hypothetical protein
VRAIQRPQLSPSVPLTLRMVTPGLRPVHLWFWDGRRLLKGQSIALDWLSERRFALSRRKGELPLVSPSVWTGLGEVETGTGWLDDATKWLSVSLELQQRGGENMLVPRTLERIAELAARRGRAHLAVRLAGAAESADHQLPARRTPTENRKLEIWLPTWTEGSALMLDDAISLAFTTHAS